MTVDAGGATRGRRDDPVADTNRARRDLSRVAAEVLVRPKHELHRKTEGEQRQVARHLDRLEILEQALTIEPRCPVALGDDVVAVERAERNRVHACTDEHLLEVVADSLVDIAIEVDEIHLVDREDEVGDAE